MSKIDWPSITAKLPSKRTPEEKAKREKLWNGIDFNGNGYLSLAEVDRGIRDILGIDALFNAKPAIIRAFNAAKNVAKTKSKHGPDYVERIEFRLLLEHLRSYFELYHMFDLIDTSDDRRVDLNEFKAAVSQIASWGLRIGDPVAEFKKVDKNGGGYILFDEFCAWALQHKLDLEDDDD